MIFFLGSPVSAAAGVFGGGRACCGRGDDGNALRCLMIGCPPLDAGVCASAEGMAGRLGVPADGMEWPGRAVRFVCAGVTRMVDEADGAAFSDRILSLMWLGSLSHAENRILTIFLG